MANKTLLTHYYKVSQSQQDYYDPVAVLPGSDQTGITSLYCFLAKDDAWTNGNDPIQPTQDQKYIKNVYSNIFVIKKVTNNNVKLVLERIDWSTGYTYDYYRDDVDMLLKDDNGFLVRKFYVRNKYNQVFKCLWNNNDSPSTDEPYFQPGSYGTNNMFRGIDGYKWKYMYTIDGKSLQNFVDSTWITVPITLIPGESYSGQTLDPIETSAGIGSIDAINVVSGGTGYDPANSLITITITGDGSGAAGTAEVDANGIITDIIVTNPGTNYTYANVTITSDVGSNATAICPTSPIGGHGYDSPSELGCSHIMYSVDFNSDENNLIPTDIKYNQIGLMYNPLSYSTYPYFANGDIYKTTTDIVVTPGFGYFVSEEDVYQGESYESSFFRAKVLSFNTATNILQLINIEGTPTINGPINGNSSGTTRTILQVSNPDLIRHSGYISYVENRTEIQRSSDGIEQFKFVIGY